MKKVFIFFANGTEEVEAITPLDYLRRAGAEVTLVGISGKTQVGSHGVCVVADTSASELCDGVDFDMIILPGGMPGTNNIENTPVVQSLIKRAVKEKKFIGAICAAPKILGAGGYLSGKRATCYPGFEKYLIGATYTGGKVERDENFITAKGAGAANEFAVELIRALFGDDTAENVSRSVMFL